METRSAHETPKKSSGHGCLIAALIVGGIIFLAIVVGGIALYQFTRTGKGKALLEAITETTRIAMDGVNAPGTAELRKLGCKQAMVMDLNRFAELGRKFDLDGKNQPKEEKELSGLMVACMTGYFGEAPSCDAVATTYVEAIGGSAASPFVVMVKKQSDSQPACVARYSKDGVLERAGSLDDEEDEDAGE